MLSGREYLNFITRAIAYKLSMWKKTSMMLPYEYQTSYQAGDTKSFITKTTTYKVINVSKTSMILPIAYKKVIEQGKLGIITKTLG